MNRSRKFEIWLVLAASAAFLFTCWATSPAEGARWQKCPQTNQQQETIFGRRPKPEPEQPQGPQTPETPPQFDFPGGESDGEDVDEAGMRDWEPEDWEKFFQTVIALISAISGIFGGVAVERRALKKRR